MTRPKTIHTKFMPEKVFKIANKYRLSPAALVELCVELCFGTPSEVKAAAKLLRLYK